MWTHSVKLITAFATDVHHRKSVRLLPFMPALIIEETMSLKLSSRANVICRPAIVGIVILRNSVKTIEQSEHKSCHLLVAGMSSGDIGDNAHVWFFSESSG